MKLTIRNLVAMRQLQLELAHAARRQGPLMEKIADDHETKAREIQREIQRKVRDDYDRT